jgi:hypothetical protein
MAAAAGVPLPSSVLGGGSGGYGAGDAAVAGVPAARGGSGRLGEQAAAGLLHQGGLEQQGSAGVGEGASVSVARPYNASLYADSAAASPQATTGGALAAPAAPAAATAAAAGGGGGSPLKAALAQISSFAAGRGGAGRQEAQEGGGVQRGASFTAAGGAPSGRVTPSGRSFSLQHGSPQSGRVTPSERSFTTAAAVLHSTAPIVAELAPATFSPMSAGITHSGRVTPSEHSFTTATAVLHSTAPVVADLAPATFSPLSAAIVKRAGGGSPGPGGRVVGSGALAEAGPAAPVAAG